MKLLSTLLLLVSFHAYAQKNAAIPAVDVQHYTFGIELNDASDLIKGKAVISLISKGNTNKIELDLAGIGKEGKGMKVLEVKEAQKDLSFEHRNDKLIISLPTAIHAGDPLELSVQYEGVPSDGLIISKNKYQDRTFFADNWPNRAHHWLPCVDDPSDKATVDFEVIAPMHYQVVANGIQIEETNLSTDKKLTRYSENVPLPTKIMVLGAADFSVQSIGEVNCIPVTAWVYAKDRDKGLAAYQPAMEALQFFIDEVGPYPYKKLANVQSKTIFGGLENANTIFYFENSVTGKNENETLVVHEVAHQWFGNSATETGFAHLWLSEGFASYFTHLFIEKKYGPDSLARRMIKDRNSIISYSKKKLKPVVDSTTKNYMDLLNPNSYEKGSWVLHMLRQKIGDSAFHEGIKNYYKTYAGSNASTDDFRAVMEKISGQDLGQFFKQWLYTAGQPIIKVSSQYSKGMLTVKVQQVQPDLYQFPLEIMIDTGADMGKLVKSIRMEEREANFKIPLNKAPSGISIDPNVNLLFEEAGR